MVRRPGLSVVQSSTDTDKFDIGILIAHIDPCLLEATECHERDYRICENLLTEQCHTCRHGDCVGLSNTTIHILGWEFVPETFEQVEAHICSRYDDGLILFRELEK